MRLGLSSLGFYLVCSSTYNQNQIPQKSSNWIRWPSDTQVLRLQNYSIGSPYKTTAIPIYNHLHFKTVCQNVLPLYTKRKPKKKARNPLKKPCQVWAYKANSWGFTNKTSMTKNRDINKGPPGWLIKADNALFILPFSCFFR